MNLELSKELSKLNEISERIGKRQEFVRVCCVIQELNLAFDVGAHPVDYSGGYVQAISDVTRRIVDEFKPDVLKVEGESVEVPVAINGKPVCL